MLKLSKNGVRDVSHIGWPRKIFIFALAFLLPMDWFSPTGLLFREFGAQPVNVLVLMVGIALSPNALRRGWEFQKNFSGKYFLIGMLMLIAGGLTGFLTSLTFWLYPVLDNKIPIVQFVLQGALLICLPFAVLTVRHYLSSENALNLFIKCMRWAAVAHICFFFLEYMAMVGDRDWLYSLFRTEDYSAAMRPSGLFSEPSYYGVAVCIYLPFIVLGLIGQRFFEKLFWSGILIIELVSLVLSGARTGMIIAVIQMFAWSVLTPKYRLKRLVIFGLVVAVGIVYLTQRTFLDDANGFDLSTIMRVGSTLLSINVAIDGWMWSGIGFGQFHFFYLPVYAPKFLFLSDEAWSFFNGTSEYRAHTFNLFMRILLETGVVGLFGWYLFCRSLVTPKRLIQMGFSQRDKSFIIASIGGVASSFSQDFYLYLPFYILLVAFGQSRLENKSLCL